MKITDQIRPPTHGPEPTCHSPIPPADALREQGVRCETCPQFTPFETIDSEIGYCDFHIDDRGTHNFCDEHPAFNKEGK